MKCIFLTMINLSAKGLAKSELNTQFDLTFQQLQFSLLLQFQIHTCLLVLLGSRAKITAQRQYSKPVRQLLLETMNCSLLNAKQDASLHFAFDTQETLHFVLSVLSTLQMFRYRLRAVDTFTEQLFLYQQCINEV